MPARIVAGVLLFPDPTIKTGPGALGGTAIYDGFTNPSPFAGVAVIFGLAILTPAARLAGSAVSGFEDTSECDDARNAFARPPESRPDATIPTR